MKLLAVVLCCIVALMLVGCSGNEAQPAPTAEASQSPTRVPPPPVSTPIPTPEREPLSLSPVRDDNLVQRLSGIDPSSPFYVVELPSRTLWRIGTFGPWSPRGSVIAGGGCCIGEGRLVTVDVARRTGVELLQHDAEIAAWSPAGDAFVMISRDIYGNQHEVYLVQADGSRIERLPELGEALDVLWRPGTQQLAYSTEAGVFLYDLVSGQSTRLATSAPNDFANVREWSPDGRYLSFINKTFTMMEVDTRRVVPFPSMCCYSTWSPDGARVALTRYDAVGQGPLVYILDATALQASAVTLPAPIGSAIGIGWSPDGRYLAYVNRGCHSGDWSLHRVGSTTGADVTLVGGNLLRLGPAWSPDGRYIAYAGYGVTGSGALSERGIYALDLWSASEVMLVSTPDDVSPRLGIDPWSPDGRYLQFSAGGGFGICD